MKKIIITLFILFSISSFAQNHYLGVQFGLNSSSVYGSDFSKQYNFLNSFSAGFTYDYKLKNGILLGSGLMYEGKGFENKFTLTQADNIFGRDGSEVRFNYLEVPLKAGYQIGKKWTGYFYLGLVPAYLLSAIDKREGDAYLFDHETEGNYDISDHVNRFELSGLFELGSNYELNNKWALFVNASYLLGLTTFYEGSQNIHPKNHRFNISLGVKYALKRE